MFSMFAAVTSNALCIGIDNATPSKDVNTIEAEPREVISKILHPYDS